MHRTVRIRGIPPSGRSTLTHWPTVLHAPDEGANCLATAEPASSAKLNQVWTVLQVWTSPCCKKKCVRPEISNHSWRSPDSNSAGAFGPDLARKLSQLVKMEKNVMRSMEVCRSLDFSAYKLCHTDAGLAVSSLRLTFLQFTACRQRTNGSRPTAVNLG